MKKELISNHSTRLLDLLNEQLTQLAKQSEGSFYFAVAFASFDGIQLLIDALSSLESKAKQRDHTVKVRGKILLSDYLYFTDPKAIRTLSSFKCIELRLHIHRRFKPLHSKLYVFNHQTELNTMVIGSSNLTKTGLIENEEMNIFMSLDKEDLLNQRLSEEFERCWQQGLVCNALNILEYEKQYQAYHKTDQNAMTLQSTSIEINDMQRQALAQLKNIRAEAGNRALIIAATGTGKTYLSAFDIKQFKPKCFLFLVHNKNILFQAQAALKQVLHENHLIFDGNNHHQCQGGLLSTSQLMYQHYQKFQKNAFDYIVIDEAHKFGGENTRMYSTLLAYFQPKFLLGMTATPERTDGFDLYRFFDDQIVANIRLRQALAMKLLVPFHYYGIADAQIVKKEINGIINETVEEIDLSSIDLDNIRELNQVLNTTSRAEYIIEKMKKYQHDGPKRKAIAFCIDIHHAQTMCEAFKAAGFDAVALTGNHRAEERQSYIQSLEDDQHSLEIICVVDIFNEGIDIPSVNLILMLRPTQSMIIFLQQLGRGLRKHAQKTFTTVLDFIANHKRSLLIPAAFNLGNPQGTGTFDPESMTSILAKHPVHLPSHVHIHFEELVRENILKQIEATNFYAMPYLRSEYSLFKNHCQRIPKHTDFLIAGAPDLHRILKVKPSYIEFMIHIENPSASDPLFEIKSDEKFLKILKFLSSLIPIKRIEEFLALKYLIEAHISLSLDTLRKHLKLFKNNTDDSRIEHGFKCLAGFYWDRLETENLIKLVEFNSANQEISMTEALKTIVMHPLKKEMLLDLVEYALLEYQQVFSREFIPTPEFKLYQTYSMKQAAQLCLYDKMHSAFRGQGVLHFNGHYFLWINLKKSKSIAASIAYEDRFISADIFQWESPNQWKTHDGMGKSFIEQAQSNGAYIHLFIRKSKEVARIVEPFTYIGTVKQLISYEGNKPIRMHFLLNTPIDEFLTREFLEVSQVEVH